MSSTGCERLSKPLYIPTETKHVRWRAREKLSSVPAITCITVSLRVYQYHYVYTTGIITCMPPVSLRVPGQRHIVQLQYTPKSLWGLYFLTLFLFFGTRHSTQINGHHITEHLSIFQFHDYRKYQYHCHQTYF